jgi:uncharacterized membrane protein (Fun14 family)
MSIPPELAWLVPVVMPFIIGLLVGAIIKRAVKLMMAVAALVIVLAATGALSLGVSDLYAKAENILPRIAEKGQALKNLLPYTSAAFLIGLALGLWKG